MPSSPRPSTQPPPGPSRRSARNTAGPGDARRPDPFSERPAPVAPLPPRRVPKVSHFRWGSLQVAGENVTLGGPVGRAARRRVGALRAEHLSGRRHGVTSAILPHRPWQPERQVGGRADAVVRGRRRASAGRQYHGATERLRESDAQVGRGGPAGRQSGKPGKPICARALGRLRSLDDESSAPGLST